MDDLRVPYRYYMQRYSYFSKFDQGILMDRGEYLLKSRQPNTIYSSHVVYTYSRGLVLGDT